MSIIKSVALGIPVLYLVAGVIIYFFQEKFIFLPTPLEEGFEYSFSTPFQEKFYKMKDGTRINALYFQAENPRGVIFYHHGNAENLERWGGVAEFYVEAGYDVLIYDYRGYGKSDGKRSEEQLFADAGHMYWELRKTWKPEQITFYGRSLGSGVACYLAANHEHKQIILETPFINLNDMANRYFPIMPTKYLMKYKFANNEHLQQVHTPIHIFHGTEDKIVPFESGKSLFESLNGRAYFYKIEGGRHNNLIEFPEFRDQLLKVLGKS